MAKIEPSLNFSMVSSNLPFLQGYWCKQVKPLKVGCLQEFQLKENVSIRIQMKNTKIGRINPIQR